MIVEYYYFVTLTIMKNNPLHNMTLNMILEELVAEYGWEKLGGKIR
jgi:uncharacterized protein (DUF2132 family)